MVKNTKGFQLKAFDYFTSLISTPVIMDEDAIVCAKCG